MIVTNTENIKKTDSLLGSIRDISEFIDNKGYITMTDGKKEKVSGILTIADILQVVESEGVAAGSVSPIHRHPEWQLFLVQKGKLILHYKPNLFWRKKTIAAGDFFTVNSNVPHYHTFLEVTSFISILIPANLAFPIGEKRD